MLRRFSNDIQVAKFAAKVYQGVVKSVIRPKQRTRCQGVYEPVARGKVTDARSVLPR